MSNEVIRIEQVSKQYRLGMVGTGTVRHDLNRWWHRLRGKEDPYLKIGEANDRTSKGNSPYVWALRDVSFSVNHGDVVGIIGRNGAGKSTLLKILSRTTAPTIGSLKVKGRIASLLEVGTGFHPELTGRENVYLNGAIMGMTKREITRKFDEIVDFAGVEKYIDTPVKRYSSGMYVRLAFGVAAHLEPEILVVDEVLAVGDAEFQKKALGKMQDVSRGEGRTVLFVSHHMAAVKTLCTRGIVMQQGSISFTGTAEEAVSEYLKGASVLTEVSLAERTNRQGNGKLRFTDFRMTNATGDYIADAISGEPVQWELHYTCHRPVNHERLIIGVTVLDTNESVVALFISDEMGISFDALPDKGILRLNIPSLDLRGELYHIRLMAFEGSTAMTDALDFVEHAAQVNVLPGDVYGSGKINRSGSYGLLRGTLQVTPAQAFLTYH